VRRRIWLAVAIAVLPIAGAAAPDLPVTELGWPAGTTAATARRRVWVLDAAGGKRIATIATGTRIAVTRVVAGDAACRAWVEIGAGAGEPVRAGGAPARRGWLCARDLAPAAATPAADAEAAVLADPATAVRWADIKPRAGADAYDDVRAIKDRAPSRRVRDNTYVVMRLDAPTATIDETTYIKTDQGYIATTALAWYSPSSFAGRELAAGAAFDFAWAVGPEPSLPVAVRDGPSGAARPVRALVPRELIAIREELAGFARIDSRGWVDAVELRRPEKRKRPPGVAATERWIDIDLDGQVAVLYEGDRPVFATLVSTGKAPHETPAGVYRIRGKEVKSRMQDPGGRDDEWNVADVPFSMRFRRTFAIHGTYWHEAFGRPRSHGCINLSTRDARRIYDWIVPRAPAGWTAVEAAGDGTPVRIWSRRDPDPPWRDYEGQVR
jgi:lipoprotein-anchoring transpeptidase ErfK/SrfK